jgi:dTDP-4-dehydrorhamnose 3,5-epimerase
MHFIRTKIEGVYLIEPDCYSDNRGSFYRTFCKNDFLDIGFQKEFVQINHSINLKKGTFRGIHYQEPPHSETKLIRCISGSIIDFVIDLRKNSPSFLAIQEFELSRSNRLMVLIPDGCAHGFQTLEDDTELIYHHTNFYCKQADRGIRFDDPLINLTMPMKIGNISDKDKSYPNIKKNFKGLEI